MSAERVDFFFDYLSPYAYFAALRLPALCERAGATLCYRPVLFAGLLEHWGHLGPAEIPPKALFTFRDCARHAAQHGVAFRAPRHHPFRPLTALRLSLAETAGADQRRVVEAIFRAGWGRGIDLGSDDALADTLDAAGLAGAALVARAHAPDARRKLRRETEAAVEYGVFGVPTVIARGELLFGNDRLQDLEQILAGHDPLAGRDLAPLASQGPSARRPR